MVNERADRDVEERERERELFRSEKDGVSREVYVYTCERVHLMMMMIFFPLPY